MQKRMNAEEILAQLAKMQEGLPKPQRPRKRAVDRTSRIDARTVEEFEAVAVIEARESMADDVQAVIDEKMERAYELALDVYYTSVELARDPASLVFLQLGEARAPFVEQRLALVLVAVEARRGPGVDGGHRTFLSLVSDGPAAPAL